MKKAIVIATMLEAEEVISSFDFQLVREMPFKMFENKNQILAISGMGLDKAKGCAEFLCGNFEFDELLNIGAAGALNENFEFGKFYKVDSFVDENTKEKSSGVVLLSCNRPIKTNLERAQYAQIADLVDMEAYAIHSICVEKNKKFKAIKFVSDTGETCDIVENIKCLRKNIIEWL